MATNYCRLPVEFSVSNRFRHRFPAALSLRKDKKIVRVEVRDTVPASLGARVSEWRPSKIDDIYRAIESPYLFTGVAEAAKKLSDRERYQHELVAFLPRLVADIVTHHAASVVEMLYTIFRHHRGKK